MWCTSEMMGTTVCCSRSWHREIGRLFAGVCWRVPGSRVARDRELREVGR